VKSILEGIGQGECESDSAEERRRRTKWTKKMIPILKAIPEEKRKEIFGEQEWQGLWEELNTSVDHRVRVIEWLESLIISETASEIEGIGKQFHAQKVQEAYRTTKSIALRRYIDKTASPQCVVNRETVERFYQETWACPTRNFVPAEENSPLFLEARIPDEATSEMEEFLLDDKNIEKVIRSRQELSASGTDGIGYSILKCGGNEGVRFMKRIIEGILRSGRTITSWKEARTILIHKKGNVDELRNWRPISITNCIYRIFTCLMARCFQHMNEKYGVFSDNQKGFLQKTNGCSEHGILVNELFQHAKRTGQNLVVTAIDFTNAFGSVPHELIMSTMKQRNFPAWVQRVVGDMYEGASSTIELRGDRSERIGWKKGVKQGCPLSPLLFNLCIEPLLQLIHRANKGEGAYVRVGDSNVEFLIQAYADDILLISQESRGIESMLKSLNAFVKWSKMEVNADKCVTASYVHDSRGHRCSLEDNFILQKKKIPNLTLSQSLKYLGSPVTARRTVKLQTVESKVQEMKTLLEKIIKSPLLTVQKIDAVKTFVLPSFDFMMLNGEVGKAQLRRLDQNIRGSIDGILKVRGLPIECHHMSWRDGGLSYPSLVDRRNILTIRAFSQMVLSHDMNEEVEKERHH
jgi:hypothetical protein